MAIHYVSSGNIAVSHCEGRVCEIFETIERRNMSDTMDYTDMQNVRVGWAWVHRETGDTLGDFDGSATATRDPWAPSMGFRLIEMFSEAHTLGFSHAEADAPPDLRTSFADFKASVERIEKVRKAKALRDAKTALFHTSVAHALLARRGHLVKVVKGRKVPLGTEGYCFWSGETAYGLKLGLRTTKGDVHWVMASNCVNAYADLVTLTPFGGIPLCVVHEECKTAALSMVLQSVALPVDVDPTMVEMAHLCALAGRKADEDARGVDEAHAAEFRAARKGARAS